MKRRIAIVGLGAAARNIHIPACAKLPDVELVGGFDPAADSKSFPFPLFPSLDAMVETTDPDIVTIATPTWHHYEAVKAALNAGCHVFCEKPFMNSLQEAEDIVALSKQLNRWVVVNQEFRFMNIHRAALGKIGDPEFGDLTFLAAHQTFVVSEQTEAGWRARRAVGTREMANRDLSCREGLARNAILAADIWARSSVDLYSRECVLTG